MEGRAKPGLPSGTASKASGEASEVLSSAKNLVGTASKASRGVSEKLVAMTVLPE